MLPFMNVSLPWDMAAPTAHEASLYTSATWERTQVCLLTIGPDTGELRQ